MILIQRRKKLLEKVIQLEKELEYYRAGNHSSNEASGDKLFKAFRSASYLMAISNSENGCYADVNDQFVKALGFNRDEIIGHTADDLHIFADLEESSKYLRLISRLKKVKDYPVTLKTKKGEIVTISFLGRNTSHRREVIPAYYLRRARRIKRQSIGESVGGVLDEIFETVTNYLALFRVGEDKKFYILDLNSKVEEVEYIKKTDVLGKCIDETGLVKRAKLLELLEYVRITENAHKLGASPNGDDSEGYYMGFPLTSGNIIITWEAGNQQKSREYIHRQGVFFMKVAETLPEMIFEVDSSGKFIFVNHEMAGFFKYSREEIIHKLSLANIYPDGYKEILKGFSKLKLPKHKSEYELIARKKDGTLVPTEIHSFASFLDDKIVGYRGLIKDISRKIHYESEIKKEKAFLENLVDSAPEAIAITDVNGKVTAINKEFTKLFGYSADEAINNLIDDLVVPSDLKDDDSVKITNSPAGNRETRKTIRQDKYGNKIHVSLISSEIIVNDKVIAAIGIYRDISRERRSQLLQEILYNISTAALKQFPINDIYPIIVDELSKIWDTNNFFLALYDKKSDTFSVPFYTG